MTDIYTKQLEEENEKLRRQLEAAQETIDYCGATWKEEINGSEVNYRLCLGNFCLAVIVQSFMGNYRCYVIRFDRKEWYWSEPNRELTLTSAMRACEYSLGFGKERVENTRPKDLKTINENAIMWMTEQIEIQNTEAIAKKFLEDIKSNHPKMSK